jgi:uncharacterized protein (DUF58 family)
VIITRTGVVLGIASALLAIAGSAAGYPELVLIAAAGAVSLVAAAGWTACTRPRLAVSRSFTPDQPRAGQTVTVTLLVTNRGPRPTPVLSAAERAGELTRHVEIQPIDAGNAREATYQVPVVRRGRLGVERTRVSRRDPLGLAAMTLATGARSEIRVHPDWHPEVGPLRAQGLDPGRTGLTRGDVVFRSLRDYQPGDPVRMIHWRATARRGGQLVVAELADLEEPVQVLLLDTAAADGYPAAAFEEAVQIAASLVMAAFRQGLRLELHASGAGELLVADSAGRLAGGPGELLDPLCDVRQSRSPGRLADAVDELASGMPGSRGSAVLGVIGGPSARAVIPALARAGHVFEGVHLILVGPDAPRVSTDGVVVTSVASSAGFAAAGGAG